jgi:erythromycin esterase-like protein
MTTRTASSRTGHRLFRDRRDAGRVLASLLEDYRGRDGESSHGTHEFYDARARMTRWMIEEKGFAGVAAEADWPDAYRVNRFVRARSDDGVAEEALRGFARFPTWMWRNTVVLDFVGWLREHNDRVGRDGEERAKAGFYGLDLYSLHRSIQEVIVFLERVDPAAAARARERYSCFDHAAGGDDVGQSYGLAAAFGAGESCEREVVQQLTDLQRHAVEYDACDRRATQPRRQQLVWQLPSATGAPGSPRPFTGPRRRPPRTPTNAAEASHRRRTRPRSPRDRSQPHWFPLGRRCRTAQAPG